MGKIVMQGKARQNTVITVLIQSNARQYNMPWEPWESKAKQSKEINHENHGLARQGKTRQGYHANLGKARECKTSQGTMGIRLLQVMERKASMGTMVWQCKGKARHDGHNC